MRVIYLLIVVVVVLAHNEALCQTRETLEAKRSSIIEAIETTNDKLEEIKQTNAQSEEAVQLLNHQIAQRRTLIKELQTEADQLNRTVIKCQTAIDSLQQEQRNLSKKYAKMLQAKYISGLVGVKWQNYLTVTSINDQIVRWQYQRQINDYIKSQKDKLQEQAHQADQLISDTNRQLAQIQELQAAILIEEEKLAHELNAAKIASDKIKTTTSELRSSLKKQELKRAQLNDAIESTILDELKVNRGVMNGGLEILNNTVKTGSTKAVKPLRNSTVTIPHGRYKHPYLSGVTLNNNGIDVASSIERSVMAVETSQVVSIRRLSEDQMMLILQGREYFYVYSNLLSSQVEIGQNVLKGNVIGELNLNSANLYELHFEVWKGKNSVDPTPWVQDGK